VAISSQPANAVTELSQLSGRVAGSVIPAGAILTTDMFPAPQTRIGTVVIPAGKRALTLKLEPVRGLSGFAGAGDHIDVFSVVEPSDTRPAGVQLILQSVEVLSVNGAGLTATAGQPGGPELLYLLAVTPAQAERLIYLTEFERLYFDLVPKGEAPVTTPGAGPAQALQTL
jgi:pilus assembly protein CpaB